MIKRIFLFVLVNILVVATISVTLSLLGVPRYLDGTGLNLGALLAFSAVVGFSGALISLAISRWMAKMMMGVKVIDPSRPGSSFERDLVQRVHRLSQKAGLPGMPEVGVYESPEVNAFATGPSKSRSLVAVSSGLLNRMDDAAVEGVLAHEVSHIANGDMVTMTLLQGVVNTFAVFLARVLAWGAAQFLSGNRDEEGAQPSHLIYMVASIVFEIFFMLLGSIVVAYFSRRREFRADAGGAGLAGREKMVHALQSLKGTLAGTDSAQPAMASLKINSKASGLMALFATHPDLDLRIEALRSRGAR